LESDRHEFFFRRQVWGWLAAVGTVAALFFDTGSPAEPKWVGVLVVFCVCLGGTWLSLRGTESNEPGD
jgi:hypothetical protein